ncbi:MAG: alpha/beta hydrolase [Silicimonas sp.]|nr:alpha/beta hydrolase [Silicimonas sp.]
MLKALMILSTSYFAWYFETYETSAVYPFDPSYATPADAGEGRLIEERLQTRDGETLVVWRARATNGKATLVYFSGNAGGLKDRADRFRQLIDAGYGVIAPAYRGSSGSTGSPDEMALLSDALSLVEAEAGAALVLYGESLGTAVAIRLAADGFGSRVVLEAPFTSFTDLVGLQFPTEDLSELITQKWENLPHAPGVNQPLLVLHGSEDRTVPIAMGRQIFELAGSDDKQFFEVSDSGHSGLWTAEARAALFAFLDRG